MASDKDIKAFCRNSGTFSIPLIQLKFSLTYKEAARVVDKFVGAGEASPLADGLSYEYIIKERVASGNEYLENQRELMACMQEEMANNDDEDDDGHDDDEEDEEDETERENRLRREHLERRRQKLVGRLHGRLSKHREDDEKESEKDDKDGVADIFAGTGGNTDESEGTDGASADQSEYEKLKAFLMDDGNLRNNMVAALKLCAAEGYLTPWLACKNLGIDESSAKYICLMLCIKGFTRRALGIEWKFLLNVSEGLFYACCQEVHDRKKSLERLAGVLIGIYEQKRQKEREEAEERRRYINSIQLRELARAKLMEFICFNKSITRTKALAMAEGCLRDARDKKNDYSAKIHEKLIVELNNMSNYEFNKLRRRFRE